MAGRKHLIHTKHSRRAHCTNQNVSKSVKKTKQNKTTHSKLVYNVMSVYVHYSSTQTSKWYYKRNNRKYKRGGKTPPKWTINIYIDAHWFNKTSCSCKHCQHNFITIKNTAVAYLSDGLHNKNVETRLKTNSEFLKNMLLSFCRCNTATLNVGYLISLPSLSTSCFPYEDICRFLHEKVKTPHYLDQWEEFTWRGRCGFHSTFFLSY